MKKTTLLATGMALVSTSAMAADAAFDNHLTSTAIVSPAQLYQVQDMKTDFAFGYETAGRTSKTEAAKSEASLTGTNLFAAGIYNVKGLGLRAGMAVNYLSSDAEVKDSDLANESSNVTFTPQAAYSIGPVVLGAAIDVHQEASKDKGATEQKATYTQFRPGVLFAMDQFEAGLAYTTEAEITPDADKTDELAVAEPAEIIVHGRYAVTPAMAFGGIVKSIDYAGVDKENNSESQTQVTGTAEFKTGPVKIEGDLGYATAYYKNDAIGADNIATYNLGAGADYMVDDKASVGGALAYAMGSDKAAGVEVTTNRLGVLVRGDMRF